MKLKPFSIKVRCPLCINVDIFLVGKTLQGNSWHTCPECRGSAFISGVVLAPVDWDGVSEIEWPPKEKVLAERLSSVLSTSISSLLKNRDFLGQQLNFSWGNINEEEFNHIADKYLVPAIKNSNLVDDVRLLMGFVPIPFDADQISVMFNCELDDAEKILQQIINESEIGR